MVTETQVMVTETTFLETKTPTKEKGSKSKENQSKEKQIDSNEFESNKSKTKKISINESESKKTIRMQYVSTKYSACLPTREQADEMCNRYGDAKKILDELSLYTKQPEKYYYYFFSSQMEALPFSRQSACRP